MNSSQVNFNSLRKVRLSYVAAVGVILACIVSFLWVNITLTTAEEQASEVSLLVSDFDAKASNFVRIMRNETRTFDRSAQNRFNQILYAIGFQIEKLEKQLMQKKAHLENHCVQLTFFESVLGSSRLTSSQDVLRRYKFMLAHIQSFTAYVKKFPENDRAAFLQNSEAVVALFDRQLAPYINGTHVVLTKRVNYINAMAIRSTWLFGTIMSVVVLGVLFMIFLPMERAVARSMDDISNAMHQAKLADRAKSEFLANMSHEIRTPMNGVMGMAELLQRTELSGKQAAFADIIVKSGSALLTIINDILDFSKIDAGQMELDPMPFQINDAIEDVATLVSTKVAEKNLELSVRINPELPRMFVGDVGRIRQIVTNLVGNAVKFTENGQIIIDVDGVVDGSLAKLSISVKDTGIGIAPEKLERIFEKFSQADESATRKHEGTGLGLAISSALVKLMDGDMQVSSELDKGSSFGFEVELPVYARGNVKLAIPSDIDGARVLIVEDNSVNRSILLENLQSWNFESAAASSGHEALVALRAMTASGIAPDCVILDYHMSEMNGGEVAKKIRADESLSELPIIMLTSVDQMEDGRNFSALGIQGHLVKPTRSGQLMQTLIQVLQDARDEGSETRKSVAMARSMARIDGEGLASGRIDEKTTAASKTSTSSRCVDEPVADETVCQPMRLAEIQSTIATDADDNQIGEHSATMHLNEDDDVAEHVDILLAEDNEVNQIVITQILQGMGCSFVIAQNGSEAMELYGEYRPKVICMDVSMPIKNGHQASREIREIEDGTDLHTPIIGVTAHAIKGDAERCFEAGMDDYLSKPVSPEKLEEKIRKWLPVDAGHKVASGP